MLKLYIKYSIIMICISAYFGLSLYGYESVDPLTKEEREWLNIHNGKIILAHDPDAKPVDYLDEQGVFRGIAADYIELLEKRLNFKFHIVHLKPWSEIVEKARNREIDVLCSFTKNQEREEWMLFTDPYINIKVVILTRKDFTGNLTLETMNRMKVTYTQGWIIDEYLNSYEDHIIRVPAENDNAAMNLLLTGDADAWITALTVASIHIEENKVTNLRVAGETDLSFKIAFASRKDWPVLHSILQKGLSLITEHEQREIFNRWIHINTKEPINKNVILAISIFVLIIIIILLVVLGWNRMLQSLVNSKTQELQKELEERIQAQRDLSANREFLNSIINNSMSVIYVKDLEGKYVLINTHYEHLFHVTSDQIQGKTDYDIFPRKNADLFLKNDQEVIQQQQPLEFEERVLQNDKEYIYLSVKFPIYNPDGQISGVGGISTDITDRIHKERQISASLKEKEVLLREIHHRVKNNLQVTSGLLEIKSSHLSDKNVINMLKDMQIKLKTMSLVHEMLYQSSNLSHIHFKEYIRELVRHLLLSYSNDDHKISMNLDIEDIVFEVDFATPCGLIISELVSNAIKYAFPENEKGTIEIILKKKSDQYELVIRDNGIGLPEEIHFDTTDLFGLNLVRMLVEGQLEGTIKVDRSKGTYYHISFKNPTYRDMQ